MPERADDGEDGRNNDGADGDAKPKKSAGVIKIPSYQEVFGTAGSSTPPPHNPYPSFSQAFSFIKSSEFYTPPPAPPPSSSETISPSVPPSTVSTASGSGQNRNSILVSQRQKGNPLLKHIRNVRWMFADVVCDYLLGQSSCALYISLRYHLLHPDYLYYRIRELQKNYKLRVVLCHVDVEDVVKPLLEVTRTAMLHDCTLLCGWSFEECARYLETLKVYENKPSDSIREHMHTDYLSRLNHALTSVRHVNKTDVVTLGSTFGSLSGIMDASMEDLARCPGIGERKVKRLYDTFHEPFRRVSSRPASVIPEPEASTSRHDTNELAGQLTNPSGSQKESNPPNVRSALNAAFAKYAEKVRRQDTKDTLPEQRKSGNGKTKKNPQK